MSATSPPTFHPSDIGTPEHVWSDRFDAAPPVPELDVDDYAAFVVVSAHPDDEALGCGGLIHRAVAAGVPVTVVLATWGEASHPHSPTTPAAGLVHRRRIEMRHALDALASSTTGGAVELIELGFPDGHADDHHDDITAAVVDAIGTGRRAGEVLVLAPWRGDGHPDHEAIGRAGVAAAARTDAHLAEYPIWFWHWGTGDTIPADLVAYPLSAEDQSAKRIAVDAHLSQTRPLSPAPGDAAILPEHVLAHFRRDTELFVFDPAPDDQTAFDGLHRDDPDPWQITSLYEVAKRAATLALLDGLPRPARALEIGCSIGALTAALADRCDHVDAIDPSPAAVARARRTHARSNTRIDVGAAPNGLPANTYDLIVLSEVGYFLSPATLFRTIEAIERRLAPGGLVIGCHWSHPIVGWPLDGARVHQAVAGRARWTTVRSVRHPDYLLDLWRVS